MANDHSQLTSSCRILSSSSLLMPNNASGGGMASAKEHSSTKLGQAPGSEFAHKETIKKDQRHYVCQKWIVDPKIQFIDRFKWNPPVVDDILKKLQVNFYLFKLF